MHQFFSISICYAIINGWRVSICASQASTSETELIDLSIRSWPIIGWDPHKAAHQTISVGTALSLVLYISCFMQIAVFFVHANALVGRTGLRGTEVLCNIVFLRRIRDRLWSGFSAYDDEKRRVGRIFLVPLSAPFDTCRNVPICRGFVSTQFK